MAENNILLLREESSNWVEHSNNIYISGSNVGLNTNVPTASFHLYSIQPDSINSIALIIDTSASMTNNGTKLVSIKNNGTENFSISKDGGITFGNYSEGFWGNVAGVNYESIVSIHDYQNEGNYNELILGVQSGSNDSVGYNLWMGGLTSSLAYAYSSLYIQTGSINSGINLYVDNSEVSFYSYLGNASTYGWYFQPYIADSIGNVLYLFNTSESLSSAILFQVSNASIPKFNIYSSGIVSISSSLIVTGSITGSLFGTSSYASTASYVENAKTASYYNGSITSASYAQTASYANIFPYNGDVTITGSLYLSTLTEKYIPFQTGSKLNDSTLYYSSSTLIISSSLDITPTTSLHKQINGYTLTTKGTTAVTQSIYLVDNYIYNLKFDIINITSDSSSAGFNIIGTYSQTSNSSSFLSNPAITMQGKTSDFIGSVSASTDINGTLYITVHGKTATTSSWGIFYEANGVKLI